VKPVNKKDIHSLRQNYTKGRLEKADLKENPIHLFSDWFAAARDSEVHEPNAFILSTVNEMNEPSSRTVLLKDITDHGLVFYTNYQSDKAKEIEHNDNVAITFLWKEIEQQVRIKGRAEKVSDTISTQYFQSRPKGSQIGAWASYQSEVITDRAILEQRVKDLEAKYADTDILPKPPFWGGYIIVPFEIEFWQGRSSRLHDRFRYKRMESGDWQIDRLSP